MSRGANQIGWPPPSSGGGSLTADQLNAVVPYSEIFLPACVWSAAHVQPAIYHQDFSMDAGGTNDDTQNAWEFESGVNREVYTTWQFRNAPIDYADPQFRFFPQFIQIADAVAPAPAEFAFMELAMGVSLDGSTSDYSTETPAERTTQCLIPNERINFACGTSGDKAIIYNAIGGDGALSLTNFNYLRFEWERFGASVSDTYGESIYFFGASIQFKTDFNNLSVYPT